MSNAIVTLNLNDFMPRETRESFQHAANRWGCEFVEITKPLGKMHHFWQKALIPLSEYAQPFDRVLQLDSDMLIRSDCPNVFDLVPAEHFGVVSRVQPGRPQWLSRPNAGKSAARNFGIVPYGHGRDHLNAGFVLYAPQTHKKILQRWQDIGRRSRWFHHNFPEQTVISCLLFRNPQVVTWLPWSFNACSVFKRFKPGTMEAFIYHLHHPRPAISEATRMFQWLLP